MRAVPLDWQHPREPGTYSDGSARYIALCSRDQLRRHLEDYAENRGDWDAAPDPADYMPEMREGTPYGLQLYETTSEGTPVSPVFPSLEELAAWCETGATALARHKWTRDQWLASFRAGSLGVDSLMTIGPGGLHPLGGE